NNRTFDDSTYELQTAPKLSVVHTGLSDTLWDKIADYTFKPKTLEERKASNRNWRKPVFNALRHHRDYSASMFKAFTSICEKRSYVEALQAVEQANQRLTICGQRSTMSDDEIKELAAAKSKAFSQKLIRVEGDAERFEKACDLIATLGLSFSDAAIKAKEASGELFSLVNRSCDEIWLRRQLRRQFAQRVENVSRDLALVHSHKQSYCSDFSVNRYRARKKDNEIALENTIAFDVDDKDNWFTLNELSQKSISNPAIRRAEMFVRLRGFEEIAIEMGHEAIFTTTTTPSRFHAVSKGVVNKNWLAAGKPTAKDAQAHLIGVWTAFRKVIDKAEIKIYGMRIAEPHHDGTPHHHMLLFVLPQDRAFVTSELKRLALADMPFETGAKKYRFKSELIDFKRGSAVGYIAKYLSKNIDGQHITDDRSTSLSGIDAAERVVTWSRINNLRQFQFIGGPSVTVWREMRRLRDEIKEDDAVFKDLSETEHYLLEKIRKSADSGDWAAFCFSMGGIFVKRKDQEIKLEYSAPHIMEKLIESGVLSTTRFGDKAQARIQGIMFKEIFKCTRFRNWQIANKAQFIRGQKQVMGGVVDIFDALEREEEYYRMSEELFQQYEDKMQEHEELQALYFEALSSQSWHGCAAPHGMTC
ncbi:MAG: replication endonuclease, partial [Aliivibrio sp.]|uniref:replication endonuclease n=1 Tax=Aliivibrio sp. TaxID=1872443 RepID=UPI001A4BE8AA|nr:replication endonuclease [Aliivibrio sp.]